MDGLLMSMGWVMDGLFGWVDGWVRKSNIGAPLYRTVEGKRCNDRFSHHTGSWQPEELKRLAEQKTSTDKTIRY